MAAPIRKFAVLQLSNFNTGHLICRRCLHNGNGHFFTRPTNGFTKTFGTIGVGVSLAGIAYSISTFSWKKEVVHPLPKVCALENKNAGKYQQFNFIADVVEKAAPAVVYIEIQGRHPFYGNQVAMSNGSGFIIREDGLILTNAHVVANKQKVVVKMKDGRSFNGVVQAVDPISDLATVKVNAQNLPVLPLGDSKNLRPGEWVVALGSPFQLSNTVTAGIVSTVQREGKELGLHKDMEYIQTDAVINFGNSGGPLVNVEGEAIGINTMKVTTGISFAIPSDYAKKFLEKAKKLEDRTKTKGWFGRTDSVESKPRYIGITMLTLTPSIINEMRLRGEFQNVTYGVFIHRVIVGSPADNGGLQPGDVIIKANQKDIRSASDMYKAIEDNQHLKLQVIRDNRTVNLNVTAEEEQ